MSNAIRSRTPRAAPAPGTPNVHPRPKRTGDAAAAERAGWGRAVKAGVMQPRTELLLTLRQQFPELPSEIGERAWQVKTGQIASGVYRFQGYWEINRVMNSVGVSVRRVPASEAEGLDFVPWTSPP